MPEAGGGAAVEQPAVDRRCLRAVAAGLELLEASLLHQALQGALARQGFAPAGRLPGGTEQEGADPAAKGRAKGRDVPVREAERAIDAAVNRLHPLEDEEGVEGVHHRIAVGVGGPGVEGVQHVPLVLLGERLALAEAEELLRQFVEAGVDEGQYGVPGVHSGLEEIGALGVVFDGGDAVLLPSVCELNQLLGADFDPAVEETGEEVPAPEPAEVGREEMADHGQVEARDLPPAGALLILQVVGYADLCAAEPLQQPAPLPSGEDVQAGDAEEVATHPQRRQVGRQELHRADQDAAIPVGRQVLALVEARRQARDGR
jgi:hypothetical protein